MLIPIGVIAAVLIPAGVWCHAHPRAALLLALAAVVLAVGAVRFCREIAPSLAVASWPPSFARPPSLRWSAA